MQVICFRGTYLWTELVPEPVYILLKQFLVILRNCPSVQLIFCQCWVLSWGLPDLACPPGSMVQFSCASGLHFQEFASGRRVWTCNSKAPVFSCLCLLFEHPVNPSGSPLCGILPWRYTTSLLSRFILDLVTQPAPFGEWSGSSNVVISPRRKAEVKLQGRAFQVSAVLRALH